MDPGVAVEQGVADREVVGGRGGVLEPVDASGPQRGDGEAEPRDGDGERVEVDPADRVKGPLLPLAGIEARCRGMPLVQEPVERAEEEGSIRRRPSMPNSAIAGVRVRSRMNSSTNTGVWRRAYFFLAKSLRSW